MLRNIKIVCAIVLPLLVLSTQPLHAQAPIQPKWDNPTTGEVINRYAEQFHVSSILLTGMVKCESGGKKDAANSKDPNGGSYGILQYQKPTWDQYTKEYGQALDYNSYHDQILLTAWAISQGKGKAWTCYRKLTN